MNPFDMQQYRLTEIRYIKVSKQTQSIPKALASIINFIDLLNGFSTDSQNPDTLNIERLLIALESLKLSPTNYLLNHKTTKTEFNLIIHTCGLFMAG